MFLWAYCVLGPGGSLSGRHAMTLFLSLSPSEQVLMLRDTAVGLWLDHEHCDDNASAVPYVGGCSRCRRFHLSFG